MTTPGLARCSDCKEAFNEKDYIIECKCHNIFCEDCWKDHNCFEDRMMKPKLQCDHCLKKGDAIGFTYCVTCQKNICNDCWDVHSKIELNRQVSMYTYREYIDKRVLEKI